VLLEHLELGRFHDVLHLDHKSLGPWLLHNSHLDLNFLSEFSIESGNIFVVSLDPDISTFLESLLCQSVISVGFSSSSVDFDTLSTESKHLLINGHQVLSDSDVHVWVKSFSKFDKFLHLLGLCDGHEVFLSNFTLLHCYFHSCVIKRFDGIINGFSVLSVDGDLE